MHLEDQQRISCKKGDTLEQGAERMVNSRFMPIAFFEYNEAN